MQRIRVLAVLCASAAGLAQPGHGISVQTVALTGQAAPGTAATYTWLVGPVLSDGGALAYAAGLSTGGESVWSRPAGGTSPALQMASGTELRPVGVSDAGAVAVAVGSSSLWTPDGSGGHTLAVQQGDPVPGVPGATFRWFHAPSAVFTDAGELVFQAQIEGSVVTSQTSRGLWGPDGAGGTRLLIREGDSLPGLPGETANLILAVQAANEGGLLAQSFDGQGVWIAPPGGDFSPLVLAGDSAPGSQSGASFQSFGGVDVTDGGVVGLTGLTTASEGALWSAEPGEALSLRFAAGGTLPGGPAGVITTGFADFELNDAGEIALQAVLSGTGVTRDNDRALLGPDGAGGLQLLARKGDPVPGAAGMTFVTFDKLLMNEAGDVVVLARVEPEDGIGIYWTLLVAAPGEELQVVVRQDAAFEVAPGEVRTVYAFGDLDVHSGYIDIVPQLLSDARQLAFSAIFIDGSTVSSGLFLVSIPEPGTAFLLLAGLLGVAAARRSRR